MPNRRNLDGTIPDNEIAETLHEMMVDVAHDALDVIVDRIIVAAKADLPVGDPALDPDPLIALKDSFNVSWQGAYVSISVDTPYAVKQHEALHFKHPRGGGAKYLERNVVAIGPELQVALKQSLNAHLKGAPLSLRVGRPRSTLGTFLPRSTG